MTQETIDVQISAGANGGPSIQRIVQARKAEAKIREAHTRCVALIEKDNAAEMLAYLRHSE